GIRDFHVTGVQTCALPIFAQIIEKNIDIVLLAGGTDGGNSEVVLYNAEMLGIYGVDVPIIYAGNKACQDEIRLIFEKYRLKGYRSEERRVGKECRCGEWRE